MSEAERILGIDTCGPLGSVGLARLEGGELTLLAQTKIPGKTYSAQLIPAIHALLSAHNTALAEIAAIVVTHGPGSFTGIRIGISTAKGLAEAHAIPLVAVSRLAVLAHKAQTHNPGIQAAGLDASRGEFYFSDHSGPAPCESLLRGSEFRDRAAALAQKLAICEPSAQALAGSATFVEPPTAADAVRCALPRLRTRAFDDPVTLDGNYLRRSDAEIFSHPDAPARTGSGVRP